jgi:dethiobiotin synthetase
MSAAEPDAFDFDVSTYPKLPKALGLFVTAAAAEAGETLIAGAIARSLRRAGTGVEVFQPVATGCRRSREGLISSETEFLAACADSRRTLVEITPVRYREALAPNVAARRARRPVDIEAIFDAYRRLAQGGDPVIVAGVGGLLCPITDDFWAVHLARMIDLPVVLVARADAGGVNQALQTLHVAHDAGLSVAGVVVNRYRVDPTTHKALEKGATPPRRCDEDVVMFTNLGQIAQRGRVVILATVPEEAANSVQKATIGPDTQFAIDLADWQALIEAKR